MSFSGRSCLSADAPGLPSGLTSCNVCLCELSSTNALFLLLDWVIQALRLNTELILKEKVFELYILMSLTMPGGEMTEQSFYTAN